MSAIQDLLAKADALLQGEPVRVISYGAIAVVWLVTHALFALNIVQSPPPSFDVILAAVSAAIVALDEVLRRFVVSPATNAAQVAAAAALNAGPVPVVPPAPVDGAAIVG